MNGHFNPPHGNKFYSARCMLKHKATHGSRVYSDYSDRCDLTCSKMDFAPMERKYVCALSKMVYDRARKEGGA